MGKELVTTVAIDGKEHNCKVLLESAGIICRAPISRTFALGELRALAVAKGRLTFTADGEKVSITLGDAAETWHEAIRNPRSRVDKLGVKQGMQVVVLGDAEAGAAEEVEAATGVAVGKRLKAGTDLVLLFAEETADLSRLAGVPKALGPKGAVWVLWPKGRRDFAHEHVVAAGKEAGLVQTKSMGFSERLTGLRLTRPASKQPERPAASAPALPRGKAR